MSMPAQPERWNASTRNDLYLTLLCIAAPSVSLTLLTVLYALSDRHCERGSAALWALSIVSTLVCAGLSAASLRLWLHKPEAAGLPRPSAARVRFQILLGLLLNLISTLLCVGLALPLLVLRRCQ